jgi:hypothetical protein
MSLVGQVDWYLNVAVCARDTCGMATVAAGAEACDLQELAARGFGLARGLDFVIGCIPSVRAAPSQGLHR